MLLFINLCRLEILINTNYINSNISFRQSTILWTSKILKKLAVATGGNPYSPAKIDDLALSFYKISEELRNQYSVAYRSTNKTRNGAFRKIKIDVKGKKLKLQYRKGYYAIDKWNLAECQLVKSLVAKTKPCWKSSFSMMLKSI